MLVAVEIFQSLIQFIIACSFVNKVMQIAKVDTSKIRLCQILMVTVFVTILSVSLIETFSGNLSCMGGHQLGSDWSRSIYLELALTLCIFGSALYLTRRQVQKSEFLQIQGTRETTRNSSEKDILRQGSTKFIRDDEQD